MKDKVKHTINFGVQECSKCKYKLRCEECCYNEKDIAKLLAEERKEMAENLISKIIKIGNKEKLGYLKLYVEDIEQLREECGLDIKE